MSSFFMPQVGDVVLMSGARHVVPALVLESYEDGRVEVIPGVKALPRGIAHIQVGDYLYVFKKGIAVKVPFDDRNFRVPPFPEFGRHPKLTSFGSQFVKHVMN